MTRSRSGQRIKVEQARAVVAQGLGDATRRDGPQMAAAYVPMTMPMESVQVKVESVLVLTRGEFATRLDITRAEVETMIAAGKMRASETGFTLMVPVSEVKRLC